MPYAKSDIRLPAMKSFRLGISAFVFGLSAISFAGFAWFAYTFLLEFHRMEAGFAEPGHLGGELLAWGRYMLPAAIVVVIVLAVGSYVLSGLILGPMLRRLERAFDEQERFIADASHQLKTPLSVLKSEIDSLNRADHCEKIHEFVNEASVELEYLGNLVEGLLILARTSAGEYSLVKNRVRIDELVLDILPRFDRIARKRGVNFKCNVEESGKPGDFEVHGDGGLLRSLFETLVDNALKHSPDGAVIDVGLRPAKGGVDVRIKDAGPGIHPEQHKKIFDRFYRAGHGGRGFGLGLAIAKNIADAHGAAITVVSSPGAGAEFIVRINKN